MIGRSRVGANRTTNTGRLEAASDRPGGKARVASWLGRHDWGMYGVGAAAAVASFDRLRLLALECGWSPRIAWLLAICIDLYAITATRRWLRPGTDKRVRRWAGALGWACVALSVAGNTVQHMLSLGYFKMANGEPSWVIVVVVAAVPPVMLASLVHVEAMFRSSRARAATAKRADKPEQLRQTPSSGSKRARLIELLEANPPGESESNYAVAKRLGPAVGLNVQSATRYVRQWRQAGAEVLVLERNRGTVS